VTCVTTDWKRGAEEQESIIAGAYRSDYTYPSTRYTTARELPSDMKAVDEESIEASHKHTPLSWMLMLTQVSVGVSLLEFCTRVTSPGLANSVGIPMLTLAVALGLAGLITSIFHLGSPFGAWRVFLGLKTSWLSREVVLFGAWMPLLKGYLALVLTQQYQSMLPSWIPAVEDWMIMGAGVSAILLGLVSVYCSIMVYVDTKRAFWSFSKTTGKFAGSVLIGGGTSLLVISSLVTEAVPAWVWLVAIGGWLIKATVEAVSLLPAKQERWSTHKKSALIQLRTLRKTLLSRWSLFALCILLGCVSGVHISLGVFSLVCLILGEYLERQIFFQAVETLKMPGNLKR